MKQLVRTLFAHPLISGSSVIFAGSLITNVFNFLFNLFMARNLTVADYGILTSLVSVITLFTLPAGSITPTVVRFGATYFAKNDLALAKGLFLKVVRFTSIIGILLLLVFLFFSHVLGAFFHIDNQFLIIIAGLIVCISYIGVANGALLQAKLAFGFITIANFIGTVLKFIVGAFLVLLGFKTNGAMIGFAIAYFVPYFIGFIRLAPILEKGIKAPSVSTKELVSYGAPSAVALLCLTSFTTMDLLLVKHFYAPDIAGMYAGLSIVGKVIFFFSAPITNVMFPLVVQRHTKEEKFHGVFLLALVLIMIPSLVLTVMYFLFPHFVLLFFLKRKEYLSLAPLLGFFGIFICIYSALSIFVNFFLSIKKTIIFVPTTIAALAQIFLIWVNHPSFLSVIEESIAVTGVLFIVLLLYYVKLYGHHT